jgi:hypothetical protein
VVTATLAACVRRVFTPPDCPIPPDMPDSLVSQAFRP